MNHDLGQSKQKGAADSVQLMSGNSNAVAKTPQPDHLQPEALITPITSLAWDAGKKLMQYWPGSIDLISRNASGAELAIQAKADGSRVTNADLASNELIVTQLRAQYPYMGILSEEAPAERSDSPFRWVIDPLDGTEAFITGREDFSVLIGLCHQEHPILGVMHFPALSLTAQAIEGQVARLNGEELGVSNRKRLQPHSIFGGSFDFHGDAYFTGELLDSGYAFLKLCQGELDAVVIKRGAFKAWDLVAPAAVVLGSGGRVTDEQDQPPRFAVDGALLSRFFVASNGHIHNALLEHLKSYD